MANQPIPNDRYDPGSNDRIRNAASADNEFQPDPELAEGPSSSGRVAMLAVAIAVVLGIVFYGLNSTTTNPNGGSTAQSTPPSQNTAQTTTPPVAPGVRDVTPRSNTAPGVTTGAAPTQPQPSTGNPPPAK